MFSVAKKTSGFLLTSMMLAMASQQAVAADPGLRISAGVRAWSNTWESWDTPSNKSISQMSSANEVAFTPVLQARYNDMFAMASYLSNTKYVLKRADGTNGSIAPTDASRKEGDFAVGYYILPSLGAGVGYKKMVQKFSNNEFTWSGPTISLNGSASMGAGVFIYGSAGFGRLNAKIPDTSSLKANYTLSEVGLAYSLADQTPIMKGLLLTAGYRSQVLTTKDYPVGSAKQDVVDTTHGPVVSVLGSF